MLDVIKLHLAPQTWLETWCPTSLILIVAQTSADRLATTETSKALHTCKICAWSSSGGMSLVFKSNCPKLGFTTFGHIFFIKWSVSLHSQLQDNKTTSIPPHLSLHPISRYLSPREQDKSASLSVLLDYDNWSVAGFVVLRTAISLSGQHNRTHKLSHATAAGLFRVHGLKPCSTTTANRSSVSPRVLQHFCHPQISVSLSGVRAAIVHHLTEKEQL